MKEPNPSSSEPAHFIRDIIAADVAAGRYGGRVVTRFPPEPNGYLHIGHAKAICIDFGMAQEFGGRCHLRMDDTNPTKESMEYVQAIQEDVRWLGFDWGEHLYFASDYFERMYEVACDFIRRGLAYVCALSQEEFKEYRGVPTRPGRESPWRNRPVEESLDLFRRMRAGEFPDGSLCLRAKIDMSSPNLHLRDPVLYRILRAHHYRTGDRWCIYPTYDFAHPLEDVFEGVTHSLCSLEFEVHRPLYDWVVSNVGVPEPPRQYEFARLNLSYTVLSKRRLLELVQSGFVSGWDDPRLPTLRGMRRRGYPPRAIREFCDRVGVTKYESLSDFALLEFCVRDELNRTAPRRLAVLHPLRVILENRPPDATEWVQGINNPEDPAAGTRSIPFGREIWIEREDFMENPLPRFYRLAPGRWVRLRFAGYMRCDQVVRDKHGNVVALHCHWAPEPPADAKVKATLHWVSCTHAVPIEFRLYDRLFLVENPTEAAEQVPLVELLNPKSLEIVHGWGEPSIADATAGETFQFERLGYFCADLVDHRPGRPVFNRTVTLKDAWAKLQQKGDDA